MTYDFRRFTSAKDMTDAQRHAWFKAGRPPLGPAPKPKPASTAMNAEARAGWDRWCKTHVNNGLYMLAYEIGAETGKIERRLAKRIADLEKEVGELRGELNVQRALAKSEIIDLPNFRKKRDAA
jgi:hypothetical protein